MCLPFCAEATARYDDNFVVARGRRDGKRAQLQQMLEQNVDMRPCCRHHRGAFDAGGSATVPVCDGLPMARRTLAPSDVASAARRRKKRVSLTGSVDQLQKEDLNPQGLHAMSGCEPVRPHDTSRSRASMCAVRSGPDHFLVSFHQPVSIIPSQITRQKTTEAAGALIGDLNKELFFNY